MPGNNTVTGEQIRGRMDAKIIQIQERENEW
jgi:hypothetical protein